MFRFAVVSVAVASVCLAAPALALAEAPSCTRGGARLVFADGSVRVVRVTGNRFLGCRSNTGQRFTLFVKQAIGEADQFSVIQGTYIGVVRSFTSEGGVSHRAMSWNSVKRRKLFDTAGSVCDRTQLSPGGLTGVAEAVFLSGGAIAYSCNQLRILSRNGDREIEPPGTKVAWLAVSDPDAYEQRLFWGVFTDATNQQLQARSLVVPES